MWLNFNLLYFDSLRQISIAHFLHISTRLNEHKQHFHGSSDISFITPLLTFFLTCFIFLRLLANTVKQQGTSANLEHLSSHSWSGSLEKRTTLSRKLSEELQELMFGVSRPVHTLNRVNLFYLCLAPLFFKWAETESIWTLETRRYFLALA